LTSPASPRERLAALWAWLRVPVWLGLGLAIGFGLPYGLYLDAMVRERFESLTFTEPARVFARPLELRPGLPLDVAALETELAAARYRVSAEALLRPGSYRRDGARFEIATRAFASAHGPVPARRLAVRLADGRVAALVDAETGAALDAALVDPARIATLHGPRQQERRFVPLAEMPPLVVTTLQAVEDRDFKHHHGIDLSAIARAALANLRSRELVQGGSTITQQLVRNLFLDRSRTFTRKLNEIAIALLIEARFDKARILEAYLNEVYLGQLGGQAVHGVAAGAEFHFGRPIESLAPEEVALLIGLIRGPSLYDPRRFPERALARRNLVLDAMVETGILTPADRAVAAAKPLGVVAQGALPRNRYPAFLELVRRQLGEAYPDAASRRDGLSVLTTLAPSTQLAAERAVRERLEALGARGASLEAAVVVTDAATGAVEAVVGARQPDAQGFNRALDARRPIGSLVKPFVYLVALAQPDRWSLMSPLSDRKLALRQPNGQVWTPSNADGKEHGEVLLVDALARSYNLATVRLGLDVDVRKVARVLEALIPGTRIEPLPSLLLGAVDLSPFQVAQAYQYLAADGRAQPLHAVEAVLGADGRPLKRVEVELAPGDLVAASRLVNHALREAVIDGTARALGSTGAARFAPAGKTGTSNDQRDSWFAGYTGDRLAVVWVGRDDNRETGLYGATGAMRVWAGLIENVPGRPLAPRHGTDPVLAWVDPGTQGWTEPGCPGARELPFIAGWTPTRRAPCGADPLGEFIDRLLPVGDRRDAARDEGWQYLTDPSAPPAQGPR
jgi:penicillin-binding protein 1B